MNVSSEVVSKLMLSPLGLTPVDATYSVKDFHRDAEGAVQIT